MAAQVKLVRTCDFITDISSLSLFNYEDGFSLARDGWIQAAAGDDDRVAEAITLHVKGTSHDDLADKLELLNDKIREVGWYNSITERYGVWLRAQMPDETYARQALITKMRSEPAVSFYSPPVAPGNFLREGYNLALERTPWWEGTANYAHLVTSINCLGGMNDYGTIRGDVAARVALTYIFGASGGGGPLYEFWMGFRTDRFSTNAQNNFVSVWDLGEDGTGSNDTTTGISDAMAHNSYRAQCTFGTETELKRIQIALQSVTTNYQDQRGSYIILLRAKVGADTTCHVRLKDGYLYTSAIRAQPRVKITSTDWFLHPLGTVDIPPSCALLTTDFLRQYGFEIWASRTAGSGYLYLDCLVLIPCAEGSLHATGASVEYLAGDTRPATIKVTAGGRVGGWSHQNNRPRATLAVEASEYTLPVGAGSVILAGQHETEHVLADYVNVEMHTYFCWRTLRGSDGTK